MADVMHRLLHSGLALRCALRCAGSKPCHALVSLYIPGVDYLFAVAHTFCCMQCATSHIAYNHIAYNQAMKPGKHHVY
jgi:hypothetical protein